MKVRIYKRNIKTGAISEDHDLKLGAYNEFYLPSVGLDHDFWVKIDDTEAYEHTTLHLKR